MDYIIKLHEGINSITFGMKPDEIESILGKADENERIDNAEDTETQILRYNGQGLTFFFEGEENLLNCIEICNEDTILFDEYAFDLDEKELLTLLKCNHCTQIEEEKEDWGEKCISFPKENIDFYFEGNDLVSISIGK